MAYLFSTSIDVHDENLEEFIACVKKKPVDHWLAVNSPEAEDETEPSVPEPEDKPVPSLSKEPSPEKAAGIPVEALRAAAAPLVDANRQDELLGLLEKYDATRLSGVPEARRKAFLKDLKKLVEES